MTRERWQRIDQLFHAVLERDPSEQEAFLDEACGGDGDLRHEVATLLAAEAEADTVKLKLPAEVAAEMVAEDQTRPIIGQRIGRYKILSLLGAGGMGDVYLAEDKRLGRKVALKLLKESFIQDAERVRRFEQEARSASALNHPNILTIHEISEADELQFIATEFVEGQTLRQRLKGARMTLKEAIGVATQVASALNAAHSARIIHRDIKPENIMLRPDGLVKVLDFGLAKLTARSTEVDSQAITAAKNLTIPGMVMGTARYMSPEQARGLEVDERTDIFSTGVVIYEMMTGRAPFSGETPSDVMAAILHHEPVPLRELASDAPIELESIVSKALCKDRDERYQVIKDLQADLNSLMQEPLSREKQPESPKVSVREISDGGHLITSPKSKAPEVIQESAPATSHSEEVPPQTVVSAEGRQSRIGRQKRRLMAAIMALIVVGAGSVYVATVVSQRYQSSQSGSRTSNLEGQSERLLRLTFDSGLQREPTWAPDGRMFAYSSNRSGNFEIWVQSVEGGNPVPIANDPATDWQPDWSPNGSQIVFRSERGGGGLFVVPALGGVSRKISSFGYRPCWSPDGKQILFFSSMLRT